MWFEVYVKALEFRSFDKVGTEVDYQTIIKRYADSSRIELFSNEKIIKLNIRFDEVFHICKGSEWSDFSTFLNSQNIVICKNKWWQFWDR